MLSLGGASALPQAQTVAQASAEPPAQAKLSLFDLAEAAATLSSASRHASPARPHSKLRKGKAQAANYRVANQSAPAIPKRPRSVRKSKGESSSPDAEGGAAAAGVTANFAAASSDGMQTRGLATRRPSVEKQPSARSAPPSKPKAKADKANKAQRQSSQPSTALPASAATQNATSAGNPPGDAAQALAAMPNASDAGNPGLKEDILSAAAPVALAQPVSRSRKLSHPGNPPEVTEHIISEPGQSLALAEGLAGGPLQEAAAEPSAAPASQAAERKPKKHKRVPKEKGGDSSQPASHVDALAATAAAGKDAPVVGEQHSPSQQANSTVPSAAEALGGAAAPPHHSKCVPLVYPFYPVVDPY